MNRFTKIAAFALFAVAVVGFYSGCDREAQTTQNSAESDAAASAEPLPAGIVLTEAPANARNVGEVVKDAKEGEEVVVIGKVGGRKEPFVGGRALMTIVDAGQVSCKEMEGDHCPTPWDYCCVAQETLRPNLATVQIVGADGKPLKADLQTVDGLAPLSEVVVKGTVQRGADGNSVVINATGLYVKKG